MDFTELASYVNDLGLVGLLLIIIVTGIRQIWVFGWVYVSVVKERDEWKRIALESYHLLEKTTDIVVKK
jgi:hypothetical protein